MPLRLLSTLMLYIFLVGYTPGPANLYAFSCSLKYGRRRALTMWRGLVVGFLIMALAVSLCCYFFDEAIKPYVQWMRYVGGAYILWLAWKIWRSPLEGEGSAKECNFLSGLVMQLTNVKIILFELTVYSIFVIPYTDRLCDYLLMVALLFLSGPVANLVWLLAGNWLRRFFTTKMKWVDALMALLLAACAVVIMVQ